MFKLKLLYGAGAALWLLALIGFYQFVRLNPWYWLFGAIYIVLSLYYFANYLTNLFWTPFDEQRHLELVKKYNDVLVPDSYPTIDIFLPVCGEPINVIKNTWIGVSDLSYPSDKIKVYVGDDKGDIEVKKLADSFGFNYLCRPDKGRLKKAGNIEYLFNNSDSEYYLVFDADFRPSKDFLLNTVPYLQDKKVGILQTPQAFQSSTGIEYGASYLQYDFYNIIQVARDNFNACICVGSNAIYRREAIAKAGLGLVDHGEDVHTGVQVQNSNYLVKYLPLDLAYGRSPDSIKALIKQHNRWCSSSTGMFFSRKVLKQSNLNWKQKLMYHIGFLYYACQIFNFLLPLQLFVVIFLHFDSINIANALWFYPYIIWSMLILPASRNRMWSIWVWVASITLVYTHTVTFIGRIFGKSATWVPTGAVNKRDNLFRVIKILNMGYVTLLLGLLTTAVYFYGFEVFNPVKLSVTFWVLFNIFMHSMFLILLNLER